VFWGSALSLLYDEPDPSRLDSSASREDSESSVEKAKSEDIASEVVAELEVSVGALTHHLDLLEEQGVQGSLQD
jgi:DNA-binding transcriptional ArsR family regulator